MRVWTLTWLFCLLVTLEEGLLDLFGENGDQVCDYS